MALSTVQICNMALGRLGANTIANLDMDDTTEAELCRAFYGFARDACLEAVDWTFARRRKHLVKSTREVVGNDYSSIYVLPADCLVVRAVSQNGSFEDKVVWEKEGRELYCNIDALDMKYTGKVENPTEFSASFVRIMYLKLAAELCVPLTEDLEKALSLEAKVEDAINRHSGVDGQQTPPRRITSSRIKSARFGGRLG